MIAGDVKTLPVELAGPSLDRNFPVGVAVEKAADDADTNQFARCRRRRQRWRRKTLRDHPADDAAVDLLQRAVIVALVREQKRVARTDRLDQIAFECSAFGILAERAQLLFIGGTRERDFGFIFVDDRQFGKT